MERRLRVVQPAHKSDKVTVAQAKRAFLKVERESAPKRVSRSAKTGRLIEKESVAAEKEKPATRASTTSKKA
jgi:hypothetical protein